MTLTHVDGKAIIERQPARFDPTKAQKMNVPDTAIMSSVEELLLDDGSTVFHCKHKNMPECEYTNPSINAVTSHQRTHSDRMMAKRALEEKTAAEAAAAAVQAELDARIQRKRDGAIQANKTRKERAANGEPHPHARGGRKTPTIPQVGDADLAKKAQQVIIAYNALQDAHDQFQNVFLGYMRAAQDATNRPEPVIDPQIVAKAAQYDLIQNALKGLNN